MGPSLRMPALARVLLPAVLLAGCVGGNGVTGGGGTPPVANVMGVTVDGGPAADPGARNHAYVTVRVCAPGSTTRCANIDHVLVDTASWGLRLVGSVLAANAVDLTPEKDSGGNAIEECVLFGAGVTWGPVALADVALAGERAQSLPVQILDDTGAAAPAPLACSSQGALINGVSAFQANGVLGIGVFSQDCGATCVTAAPAQPVYFGCTSGAAGVCTAEDAALAQQVTNPVAAFASDNNGVIIDLPNLVSANGDATVSGTLYFGINTQTDNDLPATPLNVLGTDAQGHFTATYNGSATVLPAWIDSGSDAYEFDDPTILTCANSANAAAASWIGYYCPANPPLALFAVNTGVGVNNATSTVDFALADPSASFVLPPQAAAWGNLGGGGGSTNFIWGMPYFYGRKIYVGIEARTTANVYTGPFFAY